MAKKPDRDGGEEGGELFRRALSDAEPLTGRRRMKPVDPPAQAPSAKPARNQKKGARLGAPVPRAAAPVASPPPAPAVETGRGALAGIDRRTTERLRRGKLAIEARLDLHGRFQEDAHGALNRFIVDSAGAGRRVVLVITGKGRVSEGGGVLRKNVPHWLRLAPCGPLVLAAVPAQPQHGGSGALYVMLRRKRA